jgi:RHS repeat-associated protein
MGWNFDAGSITYNVVKQTYSIIFNGISSQLWPVSGTSAEMVYNTADQSFLKIIKADTTWTIYGKDGKVYTFSDPALTSATNGCVPTNGLTTAWKWGLTQATDSNGNTIQYVNTKVKKGTQNGCQNEVDVIPSTITYANGYYRVYFEPEYRFDFRLAGEGISNKVNYSIYRLNKIHIQNKADGTNWTTVRTYDLTYANGGDGQIYPNFNWQPLARTDSNDQYLNHGANPPEGFTSTLVSIQEFGSDNSSLPATTFSYSDHLHLSEINNGQGGRVVIGYLPFTFEDNINMDSRSLSEVYGDPQDDCYEQYPYTEWKPFVAGQNVICANGRLRLGFSNSTTPTTGYRTIPEQMIKVGYPFRFNIKFNHEISSSGTIEWGIKDKTRETDTNAVSTSSISGAFSGMELNSNNTVPVGYDPVNVQLRITCPDYCQFEKRLFSFNPTYYQVASKTIYDDVTGKNTTWTYDYDNASPNTEGTSEVIKANGVAETDLTEYYTGPMMEFRGNAMTQESNSEGLTNVTWYHQSDALKGKPYNSLVMQKTDYKSMNAEITGDWAGPTSGTKAYTTLNNIDFDNSLKLTSTTTDWSTQVNRNGYSLSDGKTVISHIRLSEASSSSNAAGMFAGLAKENSTDTIGVVIMPDSSLPSGHTMFIQYNLNGQPGNSDVLIPREDFMVDKWYVLMLMVDSRYGTRLKIWQEDKPEVQAEYVFPVCAAGNWRYYQKVSNGSTWLDAYMEGRVKSESETRYTTVTQYDTDSTNNIPQLPLIESRMAEKDNSIVWTYPIETTNRTFEGDARWYGTCENYQYLTEDQNYEQFGNSTRSIVSYSYGGEWNYHHATLTKYYPKTDVPTEAPRMITSLPARQITIDCRTGCDFTGRTGLLAESMNYYDDATSVIAQPVKGNLTMQRTRINSAGQYAQANNIYDTHGNVTATTVYTGYATATSNPSDGARTTTRTYDDTYFVYPLTETNALNQPTITTYNYNLGVPVTVMDPNNNKTGAAYDSHGRMTAVCAPGNWDGITPCSTTNGTTLLIAYSNFDSGTPAAVYLTQRLDDTRGMQFVRYYNGLGKQLQTQTIGAEVNGETRNIVVNSIYDSLGRLSEQVKPVSYTGSFGYQPQINPNTDPATKTTYDVFGRATRVEEPDGSRILTSYNLQSTTQTDPKDHVTTTATDVWGRVISVTPPAGPALQYEYDMLNHLILVTKGSGSTATSTSLAYDLAGRKTGMSDPDMGMWGYIYDALGELTEQSDARSCTTQIAYDALGRPTAKTYGVPCSQTDPVNYYYDGQTFNFFGSDYGASQEAVGRRTGMTDGSGASVWSFDERGNKVSERKMIYTNPAKTGIETFDTQWEYNYADLPKRMVYPDGEVVNPTYNDQGQLEGMQNTSGFTYLKNLVYDEAGRQKSISLGSSGQNSVLQRQMNYAEWDQGGRLSSMFTRNLVNVDLQNLRYTYDANGNITTIHDVVNRNEIASYSYDSLNRLTGGTVTGVQNTVVLSENFTYDEAGRLGSKTRDGQTTVLGYSSAHPHAVAAYGANTYGYDANGNQVTRNLAGGQYALSYDGENRLVQAIPASQVTPTATATQTPSPTGNQTPQATPTRTTTAGAGPGRYDDTYSGISYSGTWNQVNASGYYNSTYHVAYTGNTWFTFPFNGARVTWEFFRYNSCGSAEIYLDGINVDEIGLFSSGLYRPQTWTSPVLEDGSHTLQVKTLTTYLVIDSLTVYSAGQSAPESNIAGAGTYDDGHSKISYAGAWVSGNSSYNYGGSARYSSAVGDKAFFTFTGERVTLLYLKTPSGGHASITIDGQPVGTLNELNGGQLFQQVWSSPPLENGQHHLVMTNVDGVIYLDALIVYAPDPGFTPTPASTIVPGGLYEDNAAQVAYVGTFAAATSASYGASGHNFHYNLSAGTSATVSFYGTHITYVYATSSSGGTADVYIDNAWVTRLNENTTSTTWQKTWVSPQLSPGYHTLRLACVSGYFYVDAFVVRGLPTVTPTAASTSSATTPTRTATPVPSATATFTPTNTNVPTATSAPLPPEAAPQVLTGAQYAYDGDGTLMRGTVNGTTTFYPGRHYNKEITNNVVKVQKFYFAGAMTIAVRTLENGTDVLNWVLSDHLGSTSTTANQDGSLKSIIQYTAFGEIRLTQGITQTKYRYTGQLAQAELGLDYYVARWYDPYLNHFTQADTLIPEPGKASAFDRYAYVNNNPLKYSDPSGHDAWEVIGEFSTGFTYEFAKNVSWYSPHAQDALATNYSESDARIVGRIAADISTIIVGVSDVTSGMAIGFAGTTIACAATGCVAAVATVGVGAVVVGAGVVTSVNSAAGLGANLGILYSKKSNENEQTIGKNSLPNQTTTKKGWGSESGQTKEINHTKVRVDWESSGTNGNVHVTLNKNKIYIEDPNDLSALGKKFEKNKWIQQTVKRSFKQLEEYEGQ